VKQRGRGKLSTMNIKAMILRGGGRSGKRERKRKLGRKGGKERRKEGGKERRKEGGKERRKEGGKERRRREGRREGRREEIPNVPGFHGEVLRGADEESAFPFIFNLHYICCMSQ